MFFAGTREFSQWFNIGGGAKIQDVYLEGNLIDQPVYFFLMLIGAAIVFRRRPNLGQLLVQNSWIWLFFLFGGLSIIWSDYPLVSFKRLIKAMGTLVMASVILTEKHPYEAFGDVLRRLAILTIPLSVILCKYYPEFGRRTFHDSWTYTGMAMGKNGLGQLCILSGFYFLWSLLFSDHCRCKSENHKQKLLSYLFLGMIAWLLYMANSATSLACIVVAACIFMVSRQPTFIQKPRRIITFGIVCICVLVIVNSALDVKGIVLTMLERRPDLTTRVPMWEELIKMNTNPLFGVGYESFWLGNRLNYLLEKFGGLHQAHNGYLEIYLNLGLIGLFLMVSILISGLLKVRKQLTADYQAAIMRLSIIVMVALYNWTEAAFNGTNNIWLLLFVAVVDIPIQQKSTNQHIQDVVRG
jgi:O-antigen ligase